MADYRAIDLTVLPFTHAVRDEIYARSDVLELGFRRSNMWDKAFDPEQLIAEMDEARVEAVLVSAHTGGEWRVPYELVADLAQSHPGRILAQAGVDPREIAQGVAKLEHAVRDLGFVGAHSYPHWFGLAPDDRAYYPFYAKCVELDVPIQVQVGKAWQTRKRNLGHPDSIDQIAVDFPDLKLIGIHIGYPWEREMIAVAAKHPNVYIGADGHHPADWSGELLDYLRHSWRDPMMDGAGKVLWGTNYPALGFRDALDTIGGFGLPPDLERALLYDNVRRVYAL